MAEVRTSLTGAAVVAAARGWLGTPFCHQGRLSGVGVDCVGLVIGVARELGLSDFDVTGYARSPDSDALCRLAHELMQPIPPSAARPGDVLLIAIEGRARHLAIRSELAGDPAMIHAWAPQRRVVEHRIDADWAVRIRAAFRLPGVVVEEEAD